jgi:hypothetical protein
MIKRHVHTTLSLKHAQLLDKLGEKYGNKQKALELALESLENCSQQTPKLSPEEQLLLRFSADNSFRTIMNGAFLWLLATADFELAGKLVEKEKPMEYTLEFVNQKPLKDCSLTEVMDGLVLVSKMSKWYDTINYSDEDDYYLLKAYHSMGINGSKMSKMFGDSLFNTYGVKFESTISEKTVFYKIYKNGQEKQTNKT